MGFTSENKTATFFRNICKNMLALIPAILFALGEAFSGGSLWIYVLYAATIALIMVVINVRYCQKKGVVLFLQWWAVMMGVALLCYFIQWPIYLYILGIRDFRIYKLVTALCEAWIIITICSIVGQVLLILRRKRGIRPMYGDCQRG